jgi:DNA replication and repair protein RecF
MNLKDLTLHQFRNYEHQSLTFGPGVNILIGENAQGKTNVIEAIHCLALGKSHRTNKDADLIQWNAAEAFIQATVAYDHYSDRTLRIDFTGSGKRARVSGVPQTKMTDYIGHLQIVLFAPEDLQLVKGGPAVRRRFLDMELGQTQPTYLYHLTRYTRALQQRNSLLRSADHLDPVFLDAFDEQLVEHGTEILLRRLAFVDQMRTYARQIHSTISDHREELDLTYSTTVRTGERSALDAVREDRAQAAEVFRDALARRRQNDLHLRYTSVGPHRDDLVFALNGQPVQSFASQGQQRTIALSVRLAEIDFIRGEVGEYPVLLLDDVLSELDDSRQRNLVLSMSAKVQTVLTTTSLFHLEHELGGTARLFHVQSGIIQVGG